MIHIENLTKHYSNFTLQLSFDLPEGKVSGLVGKNGAGKSTTIKSILGLVKKDSGTLEIFGKDIAAITAADKEDIGVALSDSGFSGYLTVESVISILKNMYHRFDEQQFRHLCQILNLPLNKKIKEFSTGMKAKLRVITAITHNARLLIMDEPTSGLDPVMQEVFIEYIRNEKKRGKTILLSSHIFSEVDATCDRIAIIKDGRIVSDFIADDLRHATQKAYRLTFDTPEQMTRFLIENQNSDVMQISETDPAENTVVILTDDQYINQIIDVLSAYSVSGFEHQKETLEDYFMKYYKEDKNFGGVFQK